MNADLCFKFSKTDWESLSQRLAGDDEDAWAEAIGVFERRMRERFFSSIDALVEADTKPNRAASLPPDKGICIPGFSIIALCCLLIDTLQGFRESLPLSPQLVGTCTFPIGRCMKPPGRTDRKFKEFLGRPALAGEFDGEPAERFVKDVRNGILHRAETKRWVIWRDRPEGKIVAREDDGFALNRSLFYEAVEREFEFYLRELRDPVDKNPRKRFKEKMDELSGNA